MRPFGNGGVHVDIDGDALQAHCEPPWLTAADQLLADGPASDPGAAIRSRGKVVDRVGRKARGSLVDAAFIASFEIATDDGFHLFALRHRSYSPCFARHSVYSATVASFGGYRPESGSPASTRR